MKHRQWKEKLYLRSAIAWIITFTLGLSGGFICASLDTPLPWMIGPLLFTTAGRLSGFNLRTPPVTHNAGQWVIGTALGLYFTPAVVGQLLQLVIPVFIGAAFALVLGGDSGWLLSRLSGMDRTSCYFSAMPGGIVAAGQVFIGCSLGCRFSPEFFRGTPKFLLAVALIILFMLYMAAAFGALLAWISGLPIASVVLGLSPGGISEMCITAKVLHLAVTVVTAFHVIQMLGVVILSGPVFARLYRGDGV